MSEVKNNRTALNKRLKGERHAKRMAAQGEKVSNREMLGVGVPRGTARDQNRKGLQAAYAAKARALAA